MTVSELRTRVLKRVGENPTAPQHYTGPMALAALNRSLRLFVLRSLCVERSDTFTLTPATAWYHVRDQVADFLLPLWYCRQMEDFTDVRTVLQDLHDTAIIGFEEDFQHQTDE